MFSSAEEQVGLLRVSAFANSSSRFDLIATPRVEDALVCKEKWEEEKKERG